MLRATAFLVAVIATCTSAVAQESFPATHIARLDIVDPLPNSGTIGGAAIFSAETGMLRVTAVAPGSGADSLLVVYKSPSGPRLVLCRFAFPQGSATLTAGIPGFGEPARAAVDSAYIWLEVYTRSDHALFAEGPMVTATSAVTPEPSGLEVVPPVSGTDGVANCDLTYDPDTHGFRYSAWWLDLTGPPTFARIRRGAVGTNGSTVLELPISAGSDIIVGKWQNVSADLVAAMKAGELYFEIGTSQHPNGELRGQIYPVEVYTAALEPKNEVPSLSGAAAAGSAFLIITAHGTIEAFNKLQGVVGNLTGPITQAHIHRAPIGQNGDPAVALEMPTPVTLDLELATGSAGGTIKDPIVQDMRATRTYVNVHTAAHASGEARGQLIPARGNLTTTAGLPLTIHAPAVSMTAQYRAASETIAFNLEADAQARRIMLYDAGGRLVREMPCENARTSMPAAGLAAGMYMARLIEGTRTMATCRVLVQR